MSKKYKKHYDFLDEHLKRKKYHTYYLRVSSPATYDHHNEQIHTHKTL